MADSITASPIIVHKDRLREQPAPFVAPLPQAGLPEDAPGMWEAAFGRENTIAAAANILTRPAYDPVKGYSPLDDPEVAGTRYEDLYLSRFIGSMSPDESRDIRARIDREELRDQVLAESGPAGFLASMLAATADPTVLLPLGGWLAPVVKGGRAASIAVRAGEGAAVVGGTVAAQEAVLQAAQETRTLEESAIAVGAGTLLGAILGGAAGSLTRAQLDDLGSRGAVEMPVTRAEQEVAWDEAVDTVRGLSAQESAPQRGSGEIKGALGAEKLAFQDPSFRAITSPLRAVRNVARDLFETPLTLAENADGIPTTVGGSVETQTKRWTANLGRFIEDYDRAWLDYYKRVSGKGRISATITRGRGNVAAGGDGLTYQQFRLEVARALREGDVSEIDEVRRAAESFRGNIDDPLKKAAIDARIFGEDVAPGDDVSHLFRVYNREMISAHRDTFEDILLKNFAARQDEARAAARADGTLDDFVEYNENQLMQAVQETVNTILGTNPRRLVSFDDLVQGERGPLRERLLRIATKEIEDFVENDPETLARMTIRTMAPDIALVEKFGRVDMQTQIDAINAEASARSREAASAAEKARIAKAAERAIDDLTHIRDRIRGVAGIPKDPSSLIVRAGRVIRNLNYLRLLGGMTLSALPDTGRVVMVYGLQRAFGAPLRGFVRNSPTFKGALKEARLAGTAWDMVLDTRAMVMADVFEDFGSGGSAFERGITGATRKFGIVSLMAPWNAAIKSFVGVVAQTKMLDLAQKVASGRATRAEVEFLAQGGIDANMAEAIWRQYKANGSFDDGVRWANTGAWDDPVAVDSFRNFLVREVDRVIVTPGQDRPIWMDNEIGKMVGQFRAFGLASTQRTLVAGLQQRDAAVFNGVMLMLGLGMVAYSAKQATAGREISSDPRVWIAEGLDRSGLLAWLTDINNVVEKGSGGRIGLSAITGEQASRYASRNVWGAIAGPTVGTVQDAFAVTRALATGEITRTDTTAVRRLLPWQNVFYLRWLFDQVEKAAGDALDLPERAN